MNGKRPRITTVSVVSLAALVLLACETGTNDVSLLPPSGLSAVARSAAEVSVRWTDETDQETGYVVERSTSAGSGFSEVASLPANFTSVVDTTVDASTTYYYRVCAQDGDDSVFSGSVDVRTPPAALEAPRNLEVTPLAQSTTYPVDVRVQLSWDEPPARVDEVAVIRYHEESASYEEVARLSREDTVFSEHLTDRGRYSYALRALSGESVSALTPARVAYVAERVQIANSISERGFVPADIDADGDTDFVTVDHSGNTVRWWENDGSASFTEHDIDTAFTDPEGVAVAHLDGSQAPEVIAYSENLLRYYQDAITPGTFQTPVDAGIALALRDVVASDMNDDTLTDLVSASDGDNGIYWWESDGQIDPSFVARTVLDSGSWVELAQPVDLDGDGDKDIVALDSFGNVSWFSNDGAGAFTAEQDLFVFVLYGHDVSTADIENDGDLDIVVSGPDEVVWLENDGNEFGEIHVVHTRELSENRAIHPVDLNGDDLPELLWTDGEHHDLYLAQNMGSGSFSIGVLDSQVTYADGLAHGDFDGDRDVDVIAESNEGNIYHYDM